MKALLLNTLTLLCMLPLLCGAQIRVDTSINATTLVSEHLIGNRIKFRNIRYLGSKRALAYFKDESESPLIGEGLLLSTGDVFRVAGPNKFSNMGVDLNGRGDRALQVLGNGPTFDAAMIEFEFTAQLDYLSFNFIFASEEYTEYANSHFNDVFAFYIKGPGITSTKNLAVVPGSGAPITVNTVNHIFNTANYLDNDQFGKHGQLVKGKAEHLDDYLHHTFEFDGMTTLLRAETAVIPGEVYHIRICIADVGDYIYDSAVFLEGKSFSSYPRNAEKREALMAAESAAFRRRSDPVVVGKKPEIPVIAHVPDSPSVLAPPASPDAAVPEPRPASPDTAALSFKPSDLAPVKGNPWRFEFGFDSHTLLPKHKGSLDTVAAYLRAHPQARLRIEGHTDNVGGAGYNEQLSKRRSLAVQNYLLKLGVAPERTETGHYGYQRPLESNAAETGRARNRRVEIILLK